MTTLDRLDVVINEVQQELAMLDSRIESWKKLPAANDQQRAAIAQAVANWTEHKAAPEDVLAMLNELRAKCVAAGMKNTEKCGACICPEHATDEGCPVCVAGYVP